jgi:hypothetical protein
MALHQDPLRALGHGPPAERALEVVVLREAAREARSQFHIKLPHKRRNRSSVKGGWSCGQNSQPEPEGHQRWWDLALFLPARTRKQGTGR